MLVSPPLSHNISANSLFLISFLLLKILMFNFIFSSFERSHSVGMCNLTAFMKLLGFLEAGLPLL